MTRHAHIALVVLLFTGTGCATFPELDGTIDAADRAAPFPTLSNIDDLLSQTPTTDGDTATEAIAQRVARLQARAAALRRTTMTTADRERLTRGVAVPEANG